MTKYWAVLIFGIIISSCSSTRRIDQSFDLRDDSEKKIEFRATSTKHIDSVNINALRTDVWKLEHYSYPDSIRLFVRVLDTTGFVVTHMAAPYKKENAPDYFPKLMERLGERRRQGAGRGERDQSGSGGN